MALSFSVNPAICRRLNHSQAGACCGLRAGLRAALQASSLGRALSLLQRPLLHVLTAGEHPGLWTSAPGVGGWEPSVNSLSSLQMPQTSGPKTLSTITRPLTSPRPGAHHVPSRCPTSGPQVPTKLILWPAAQTRLLMVSPAAPSLLRACWCIQLPSHTPFPVP